MIVIGIKESSVFISHPTTKKNYSHQNNAIDNALQVYVVDFQQVLVHWLEAETCYKLDSEVELPCAKLKYIQHNVLILNQKSVIENREYRQTLKFGDSQSAIGMFAKCNNF